MCVLCLVSGSNTTKRVAQPVLWTMPDLAIRPPEGEDMESATGNKQLALAIY